MHLVLQEFFWFLQTNDHFCSEIASFFVSKFCGYLFPFCNCEYATCSRNFCTFSSGKAVEQSPPLLLLPLAPPIIRLSPLPSSIIYEKMLSWNINFKHWVLFRDWKDENDKSHKCKSSVSLVHQKKGGLVRRENKSCYEIDCVWLWQAKSLS